jgi:hypothetical protein
LLLIVPDSGGYALAVLEQDHNQRDGDCYRHYHLGHYHPSLLFAPANSCCYAAHLAVRAYTATTPATSNAWAAISQQGVGAYSQEIGFRSQDVIAASVVVVRLARSAEKMAKDVANIAKVVLFISACTSLFGLGLFLFRDQIRVGWPINGSSV